MSLAPGPVFAPTEVTAPAGTITLFLTNPDARSAEGPGPPDA